MVKNTENSTPVGACDCTEKNTQAQMINDTLKKQGKLAEFTSFPDCSINNRGIFNTCPSSNSELEDPSIGLLFSANRYRTELNREITPILIELLSLGPGNDSHSVFQQLSNWLQDPQRTGEEFKYVIGELANEIMSEHGDGDWKDCMYLVKATAEALTVKCPILEGSWEEVAWLLIFQSQGYVRKTHGYASLKFSNWIIHVIGDPNICPNPCLRFELLNIVWSMVDINICNRTQAIESVLSACSFLSTEYLETDLLDYQQKYGIKSSLSTSSPLGICSDSLKLGLNGLSDNFCHLGSIYCSEFDKKLAAKLLDMKASYNCKKNSIHYTPKRELYGIISLVKTIGGTVQNSYKEIQISKRIENFDMSSNSDELMLIIRNASSLLQVLITLGFFKESFQTPQLVGLTASCIINILKVMIQINVDIIKDIDYLNRGTVDEIESILNDLFYQADDDVWRTRTMITPLGLEIVHNYKEQMKINRVLFNSYHHFNYFDVMKKSLDELHFYKY